MTLTECCGFVCDSGEPTWGGEQIYKHVGPSYNFEFVRDLLESLDNIINVGEIEAEERRRLNAYALRFDLSTLDSIGSVLAALRQGDDQGISQRGTGRVVLVGIHSVMQRWLLGEGRQRQRKVRRVWRIAYEPCCSK